MEQVSTEAADLLPVGGAASCRRVVRVGLRANTAEPGLARCGHLSIAEHAGRFAEGEIGGDDDGGGLIDLLLRLPSDILHECFAARLSREISVVCIVLLLGRGAFDRPQAYRLRP